MWGNFVKYSFGRYISQSQVKAAALQCLLKMTLKCCQWQLLLIGCVSCHEFSTIMLLEEFFEAGVYQVTAYGSGGSWRGGETAQQVLPSAVFSLVEIGDVEQSIGFQYG